MLTRFSQRLLSYIFVLLFLGSATVMAESGFGAFSLSQGVILPASASAARTLRTSDVSKTLSPCACADATILIQHSSEDALSTCKPVCLGQLGFLIVRMAAAFKNGSGPDLRIYELGSMLGGTDDTYNLYISQNGHEWLLLAEDVTNERETSYAEFELRGFLETYWFVKIEPSRSGSGSLLEGPEILAIEALHAAVEFDL